VSAGLAGAVERSPGGRRSGCTLAALLITFGSLLVACEGDRPPGTLMDGSPALRPPVELEHTSRPAILTKTRVVTSIRARPRSPSAACLRAHRDAHAPRRLVERIGVAASSVTFSDASGLYGCDDGLGADENGRRFCGTSFGRLYDGRLRDPRLDLAGCRSSAGDPIGFIWVQPARATRYVAVAQQGYVEVYEVAGRLPVRIATTAGVDVEDARASFDLSEHDVRGRLVRSETVDAVVAG
jgi:hypothetical protein